MNGTMADFDKHKNRTGERIPFDHPIEEKVDIVHVNKRLEIDGKHINLGPGPVVTPETPVETNGPIFWGGGHGPVVEREAKAIEDRHAGQHNDTELVDNEAFNATGKGHPHHEHAGEHPNGTEHQEHKEEHGQKPNGTETEKPIASPTLMPETYQDFKEPVLAGTKVAREETLEQQLEALKTKSPNPFPTMNWETEYQGPERVPDPVPANCLNCMIARGDFDAEKEGATYNETELPEHHKFNETGHGHPKHDGKHDQGTKGPVVLTG
jgi:hypothetical protein